MNDKYDNLSVMLASGQLNWVTNDIYAILATGAVFTAADTKFSQTGGNEIDRFLLAGRSVREDGALMAYPASFNRVAEGTDYQVLVAKEDGWNDPLLVAFFDEDGNGDPITVQNKGTLMVRPVDATDPNVPSGVWVTF